MESKLKTQNAKLAFVALGSNLRESIVLVREAMDRLQKLSELPIVKSSLWKSAPIDCPPGSRDFVNAVVGFLPREKETPESLLWKLQELEKEFGRQPKMVLNEARPLDLDLISFADETRDTERLTLPHLRATERRFVLEPLNEIAPELVLPGQSETVHSLLEKLGSSQPITRCASAE